MGRVHSQRPAVLVVEDDRQASGLLAEILTERGMRVVQAFTGPDGMRLAHAVQPDLVLLDLMPFKSGDEVLRSIRAQSQVHAAVSAGRLRVVVDLPLAGA